MRGAKMPPAPYAAKSHQSATERNTSARDQTINTRQYIEGGMVGRDGLEPPTFSV